MELEGVDEGDRGIEAAGDVEGEDRAHTLGQVGLCALVPRARLEAGVGDAGDLVVSLEVGGDLLGVGDVAFDAQAQRLQALGDEEGVERADRRTEVARRWTRALSP